MAFDGFRGQSQAQPRAGRRITVALSIAFHGALLAAGVAYSFWHIDELTPPSVKVTFLTAAPPPPPTPIPLPRPANASWPSPDARISIKDERPMK